MDRKPKSYFDYSEWQNTGNKAIDMVAACVGHYRHFGKPLKTVYLKPQLYDLFRKGMEVILKQAGQKEISDEQTYKFDDVDVERASYLMLNQDMYVDFWEKEKELN